MRSNDDGRRNVDAARGKTERPTSGLLRAREMVGFDFSARHIDVRGWRVVSADAMQVGTVDAILIEIRTRKVRYLLVELSDRASASSATRVLVPIGLARRIDTHQIVVLSRVTARQLAAAPRISDRRPVTRNDELAALYTFGLRRLGDSPRDLYDGGAFDEAAILS